MRGTKVVDYEFRKVLDYLAENGYSRLMLSDALCIVESEDVAEELSWDELVLSAIERINRGDEFAGVYS